MSKIVMEKKGGEEEFLIGLRFLLANSDDIFCGIFLA